MDPPIHPCDCAILAHLLQAVLSFSNDGTGWKWRALCKVPLPRKVVRFASERPVGIG